MQSYNVGRCVDLIRGMARRKPHAAALHHRDRSIGYAELCERALRLANGLLGRGLKPGDRVGILAKNCPEYVEIYLALQLAGLVAVPINFRLAPDEVRYVLENCAARGLILAEPFLDTLAAIGPRLPDLDPRLVVVMSQARMAAGDYEALIAHAPACELPPQVLPTAPGVIFYTSGTTGFPKGAVMSALNVLQRMTALGWELGIDWRDVMLVPGPLFHLSFSFMCMIPLCIGGKSVILDDFDPPAVMEAITGFGITRAFMVPKMFSLLLDAVEDGRGIGTASVRNFLSSGSALPRDVFHGLAEAFPNARIGESMGWTESSWIVFCPHEDLVRKEGSAGRAAFGADLAILDENGAELPPGAVGQIYGACPIPFLGYYGNPQATAQMRRGRWETGGDVGYRDEEGFLYILDRKRDMIISGGENIYPAELERVIERHPQVLEVAVVGVHDPVWGEAPRACVVPRAGGELTPQDVVAFCDGKLARYKLPRSVVFLDALPRNSMGKVLRRELRERYAAEADA